jgi:hypothetical protein
VHASEVRLAVILERIAERANVELVVIKPEALERTISVDIEAKPLEWALEKLLADFDKIFVSSGERLTTGDLRVARVVVAGVRAGGEEDEEIARASAAEHRRSQRAGEFESAADRLVPALDRTNLSTFANTVRAINELDPGRAATELIKRLERTEEPRNDAEAERQRAERMRAAYGLGLLVGAGNFDGVDALANAAQAPDPDLARVAKNSLAQQPLEPPGPVIAVVTEPYLRLSEPCDDCVLVRTPLGPVGAGPGNSEP